MEKIQVCEYVSSISDGGAETLVKDYCLLLDKKHFQPNVITTFPQPDTGITRVLQKNNIPIYYIYPKWNKTIKFLLKPFNRTIIKYRLITILNKTNAKVLHVHLPHLKDAASISRYLKKQDIKVFYTCHSLPRIFFYGKNAEEKEAAEKLMKKNKMQMIAIESSMVDEINNIFGINNTVYIHNGVDKKKFINISETKTEIRKSIGVPEDCFLLGQVGRFVPLKNQLYSIEILKEAKNYNPKSKLLLIGNGSMQETLNKKIDELGLQDSVIFLHKRSDVNRLLKAMDVFIYPAWYEGLGIVMIEAQMAGLKCVVSDTMSKDVFISNHIFPMSIKDSPKSWCDVIFDDSLTGEILADANDFDMNHEIKKLENLYIG